MELMEILAVYYYIILPGYHTNYNESFNSMKSFFIHKDNSNSTGFLFRFPLSVIAFNEPEWKSYIRARFNINLVSISFNLKKKVMKLEEKVRINRDRKSMTRQNYKKPVFQHFEYNSFAIEQNQYEKHTLPHSPSKPPQEHVKFTYPVRDILKAGLYLDNWQDKMWYVCGLDDISIDDFYNLILLQNYRYYRIDLKTRRALLALWDSNAQDKLLATIWRGAKMYRKKVTNDFVPELLTLIPKDQSVMEGEDYNKPKKIIAELMKRILKRKITYVFNENEVTAISSIDEEALKNHEKDHSLAKCNIKPQIKNNNNNCFMKCVFQIFTHIQILKQTILELIKPFVADNIRNNFDSNNIHKIALLFADIISRDLTDAYDASEFIGAFRNFSHDASWVRHLLRSSIFRNFTAALVSSRSSIDWFAVSSSLSWTS